MSSGMNPLLRFASEIHEIQKKEQDNLEWIAKKVQVGKHQFNNYP